MFQREIFFQQSFLGFKVRVSGVPRVQRKHHWVIAQLKISQETLGVRLAPQNEARSHQRETCPIKITLVCGFLSVEFPAKTR